MRPCSIAPVLLAALCSVAGGCGGETSTVDIEAPPETSLPTEYGQAVIHHNSSYKAMKYLDQSIPLYYPCDSAPKSYTFVVRGTERGRSGDCESASIKALMALQQSAAKMGANAIINLAASWDGVSMMSYSGLTYHCKSGFAGNASGVDWSGDFVIVAPPSSGKVTIKPQPSGSISIKPVEPSSGSGETPPGDEGTQEQ